MHGGDRVYSLPRWRLTHWLADAGPGVPDEIRAALMAALFGSLPVFAGGVINSLLVSAAIAVRMQTAPFIVWFVSELAICGARLIALVVARRAALRGGKTPTDIYLMLSVAWSACVGYGAFLSLTSGDWVVATLACLSGAAMVGGICFRNFGAPRLAAIMIMTSLGPCVGGALLSGEPLLYVVAFQAPMYLLAMTAAAYKLNKMMVATMRSERENDHRARHDALTGLTNRAGLIDAVERKLESGVSADGALALLFLDLDGFKIVNDTYGHAAGDQLLMNVAESLRRQKRTGDIVARIGGDEFVVLAEDMTRESAIALGEQLTVAVTGSYAVGNGMMATIGVSVGIAMAPEHGSSVEDLMAVADAALYDAKSNGKARWCMGSTAANLAALQRLRERSLADGKISAAA